MLWTLIIGYGSVVLAAMIFQRRLIYFPTQMTIESATRIGDQDGFLSWKNESGQIIGWRMPAPTEITGVVLIVHGNAGCAVDRAYLAKPIHAVAAMDVFVLEYPGYGAREGSPGLRAWLDAADEAFDLLPKNVPKFIVSESIGAGAAAHLAKTYRDQIAGMLMFAPYDSFASLAQSKMPFLPVQLILKDRFEPAHWLKGYQGPVGIVLAEWDEVIPPKFGRRLYDAYAGPKWIEIVPGATHNEIAEQPPEWWRKIFEFWEKNKSANVRVQ